MDSFEKWWEDNHAGKYGPVGAMEAAFKELAKKAYRKGFTDGEMLWAQCSSKPTSSDLYEAGTYTVTVEITA